MLRSRTRNALSAALVLFALVLALILTVVPQGAPAAALSGSQFDPSLIISDANFYDGNAMSQAQIQTFLESKVPSCANGNCLTIKRTDTASRASNAYCSAYGGAAAELTSAIIFKVQQACGISAKVILVTLQKEQGLVTATAPTDGKLERAMGYACPDNGQGCDPTYAGLYNQIYRAAWQLKRYGDPGFTRYPVGRATGVLYHPNAACGAGSVTIRSKATAALYYYTPYQPNVAALANLYGTGDACSSYGNRNFWRYYNDWFGTPTGPPGSPDGELTVVSSSYGFINVAGWAADSSDPLAAITVAVQVDASWYALTAGERVDSLATDYPVYGADHGFSESFAIAPGNHTVCVYAMNTGPGGDTALGCRTVTAADGSPKGALTSVTGGVNSVALAGWVVDTDSVDTKVTLDIQVGATWFSTVASASSPGTDAQFPGAGESHGISFSGKVAPGTYPICVYARNVGVGATISLGCSTVTVVSAPPLGAITAAAAAVGGIDLAGWAVDPDTLTTPVVMDIQVGAKWYVWTANASTTLSEAAVPGSGSLHGFSGTLPAATGSQTVCVYPRNTGAGPPSSLGCRSVTVVASASGVAPVGALQTVSGANGRVSIAGWAVDADAKTTALTLDVQLDGWKSLTANQSNPAGETAVPGAGASHGFVGSWAVPAGVHTLCVYVKGQGAGGDASLGCRSVTVVASASGVAPVGALDVVTGTGGQVAITGWAVDADALTTALTIDVQLDGWKALTANQTNAAGGAISGAGGSHGFSGAWSLPAGSYTMCVYVKGQGAGGDTSLGCRIVVVTSAPALPPVGALETVTGTGGKVSISGWAADGDAPLATVTVDVQFNGWQWLAANQANPASPSVLAGSGTSHGFSGSWAATPGTYPICVYAKGLGAGGDASLGCRYVTVTP